MNNMSTKKIGFIAIGFYSIVIKRFLNRNMCFWYILTFFKKRSHFKIPGN